MTKPYFSFIKYLKVLCFAALCASCKEEPPFIKLNNDEIKTWNENTLEFLENCCRNGKIEHKLFNFHEAVSSGSRNFILNSMKRFEIYPGSNKLYYCERQLPGENYLVTIWFDKDEKKRTFTFSYNHDKQFLDESIKVNNEDGVYDHMVNHGWYFEEECCEVYYPTVVSVIFFDDEYYISQIEVEGYMFLD